MGNTYVADSDVEISGAASLDSGIHDDLANSKIERRGSTNEVAIMALLP